MKRKRAAKTGPSKNRRIEEAANDNERERAASDIPLQREQPAPSHNQQDRERASGTGAAVQGEDGFDDADISDDPDGEQQFGAEAHTSGIQQLPASSRSRPRARPSQTQHRPRSPIHDGAALQGPGAVLANQLPVPPKRGRGRPPAAARPGVNVAAPNIHNQPPVPRKRRVRNQDLAPALQIQPPQFDQQHLLQVENHQLREQSLPSRRRQNRRGEREIAVPQQQGQQQDGRGANGYGEPEPILPPPPLPRQRRRRQTEYDGIQEPGLVAFEPLTQPMLQNRPQRRGPSAAVANLPVQPTPPQMRQGRRNQPAAISNLPEQRPPRIPSIPRQGRRGDVATIQELPVQSSRAQRRSRHEEHATLREVHDTRTLPAPTHDGASAARHVIAAAQPSTLQASSSALRATSRPQKRQQGRPTATVTSSTADQQQVQHENLFDNGNVVFPQQDIFDDFNYSSDESEFDSDIDPSDLRIPGYNRTNFNNFSNQNQLPTAHSTEYQFNSNSNFPNQSDDSNQNDNINRLAGVLANTFSNFQFQTIVL
ncbi:hypothetical protein QAD02_020678 [Eretmocerus hayati]|uniref:Uncharacterized protein n=1 Tax=Eretmocerus hayati TaxID=131215 RepID=A0ACC2PSV6_9HYME|nr:hypothetical protein QAD02_020678 [Eretmocerus hayati]